MLRPAPGQVTLSARGVILSNSQLLVDLASRQSIRIRTIAMSIIWTIIIGLIAGVIAKFITPGKNEPSGFILTTILGIAGAFLATYIGQSLGWYRADEGAGLIGAVVGAVIILVIWGLIAGRRSPSA